MDDEIHEGGCLCGAIRYRVRGRPDMSLACHCRYCQKRLGTAFATIGYFPAESVLALTGARTLHEHRSDESGRTLRMGFCPRCGTTVTTELEFRPRLLGIALGTLDDPDRVPIRMHIWLRSKRPWADAPPGVDEHDLGSAGPARPPRPPWPGSQA
jgi:hypothetical protein